MPIEQKKKSLDKLAGLWYFYISIVWLSN